MTLAEAYDAHFDFVWKSLRRLGVPEADVEDVLQDVFLIVHRKLPEFEGRAKLTTWLYAICIRVASDRRRLARTRKEVSQAAPETVDERADVAEQVERREAAVLLERILDRMPFEQRTVSLESFQ